MAPHSRNALIARMREVVTRRADHVAVREHAQSYTYAELGGMISRLCDAMNRQSAEAGQSIGLLLDRSARAYAAMWASIVHGRPYVPLNTAYPQSRLRDIISQARIGVVVCDRDTRNLAHALGLSDTLLVDAGEDLPERTDLEQTSWHSRAVGDIAYVLFTSGSTGRPKGVPISYDNLLAFIENMEAAIEYRSNDVCSQVCELSFDFSVHEVYLALLNGCTLCPARRIDLFNPAEYIETQSITVWIAVPSLARVILNNGLPIGNRLDGVRVSIFNGEALTTGLAAAWRDAAPNTEIWNSYGPTECTVAVTTQRWNGEPELAEADVVAIGAPFANCRAALLDDDRLVPVSDATEGSAGELLLASPQRFAGYTDTRLASPFVTDSHGMTYYRTGDHVRWRGGRLYHLGRVDNQVKIGGHRIELMEIEHRLRRHLDTEALAVVAHPAQRPTELILFIEDATAPTGFHAEALGLPSYMLPARTIAVDALPTNSHGKLDRFALHALVDSQP